MGLCAETLLLSYFWKPPYEAWPWYTTHFHSLKVIYDIQNTFSLVILMAITMKWVLCNSRRGAERSKILKFWAEEIYTGLTPTSWTLMTLTQALCAVATEIFLHKFWVELWVMETIFFYNNRRNVFLIKIKVFLAEIHLPKKKKGNGVWR